MDANNEPCTTTGISFSTDVVTATLPLLTLKEVNLDVNIIEGAGATRANTKITIDPASVTLAGDSALLAGMNKIILATIDLTDFSSTFTETYTIPIDNELKNTTGVTKATVTVEIVGLEVIGNVGILSHGDVAEVGLWSDCHNTAQVLAQLAAEPSVFALQGQSCLKPSFGHDKSIVNGISRIGYMKGGGKALWKDENIADSILVHAQGFIQANKDKPFFMYFATNDVHVPRFPHPRFRGQSGMGLRGDAIVQFDWAVGQLMETLDKLGIADNTLILLSSDNGPVIDDGYQDQAAELLNGHKPAGPWRGNKYSAYEGGTAVPMIVRWPGKVKGGQTSATLTSQIDWMASLGNLIGARFPKGSAPDSENRLGNWLGTDNTDRPYVLELAYNRCMSVRTSEWKYIEPSDGPKILSWAPGMETGSEQQPQQIGRAHV